MGDSIDNDDETPDQEAIDWVRSRIQLKGFDPTNPNHWEEGHEMTVSDFLASSQLSRLLVYISLQGQGEAQTEAGAEGGENETSDSKVKCRIVLDTMGAPPEEVVAERTVQFFLKDKQQSIITLDATKREVQYGFVTG